jgi:hypothetical protein
LRGQGLVAEDAVLSARAAKLVGERERMTVLDARLPSILHGESHPVDPAERAEFARLCHIKHLHATAARLWEEAFVARPSLIDDLTTGYRYDAACDDALGGCGEGRDDPPPDDGARAKLRARALERLRADLAARSRLASKGTPQARTALRQTLGHWKRDSDLTGVRDPDALGKLPEAERKEWETLWADLDALLKRAQVKTP